jgi:hypothetical protein
MCDNGDDDEEEGDDDEEEDVDVDDDRPSLGSFSFTRAFDPDSLHSITFI